MKHTQKKKNKINKKETSYTLLYIRVPSKKCSIIIVEMIDSGNQQIKSLIYDCWERHSINVFTLNSLEPSNKRTQIFQWTEDDVWATLVEGQPDAWFGAAGGTQSHHLWKILALYVKLAPNQPSRPGASKLFCKGRKYKYFGLCGPYALCYKSPIPS